jgi:hypothetical protein
VSQVTYKSLGEAIDRLRQAMQLLAEHPADSFTVALRDSVLLSFQFTYGVCRPLIERFLVDSGDDPKVVQGMTLASIIRVANQRGLSTFDWPSWSRFCSARNRMAHSYSQVVAEEILLQVPGFLNAAVELFQQLTARSQA